MFGGRCQNDQYPRDTWEWDGTNWTQRFPVHVPTDATWLEWDPHSARVVSYGGRVPSGTFPTIAESWSWNGADWTQLPLGTPNPGSRASPIAWSPLAGGLMTYGGHAATNETWLRLGSAAGASYSAFGAGCLGPTALMPTLSGVGGEPPRLGTTSRIRVSNLPLSVTVPVFVLGLSNTQDPGPPAYPLPLDLGILGWPGCSQLVSDDVIDFAITTTGQADYVLPVPMSLGLLGFTFHAQALVLYSPTGVATSNGVTGVVGF
jgi:hypothetical protein